MLRLIDAGAVPWLRSQALYHGLAHARTAETPDTVVLATPREPETAKQVTAWIRARLEGATLRCTSH